MADILHIVLVGDPVEGFSAYGPFRTEEDAISWGVNEHELNTWFSMKLLGPELPEADEEMETLTPEQFEAFMKDVDQQRKTQSAMPKEVLVNMSAIPEGT